MKALTRLAAAAAFAGLLATPASAGSFCAATVVNVPFGDALNARRWPSPQSRVQTTYDNGEQLSLTGKCRNVAGTRSVRLDDATGPQQRRTWVRQLWCEIWHDPYQTGNYRVGWVWGKFLRVE